MYVFLLSILGLFLHEELVNCNDCPESSRCHEPRLTLYHSVNPFGKQHGAPEDSDRHVGDLGNFKTDGQGNAKGSVEDKHIKLIGEQSVLGVRRASSSE